MEEERKAIRTMREFVNWYDGVSYQLTLSPPHSYALRKFYDKFKYLIDQEPPEKPLIIERQ
jgi:hypothetical protein